MFLNVLDNGLCCMINEGFLTYQCITTYLYPAVYYKGFSLKLFASKYCWKFRFWNVVIVPVVGQTTPFHFPFKYLNTATSSACYIQ